MSLFSGIGGLDLGLEWAGWICVGQVEADPFALAALAKHWPAVPRWSDVREVTPADAVERCGRLDAIVGGFPCQDVSIAGRGVGVEKGERSGLWREFARLARDLRPRWVLAENVPALRYRGADLVIGDLEAIGYTVRAVVVGADDCGAPHRRKRVFVIGHLADSAGPGLEGAERPQPAGSGARPACGGLVADAARARSEAGIPAPSPGRSGFAGQPDDGGDGHGGNGAVAWPANPGQPQHPWEKPRVTQSGMGGAAHGLPGGFSRWRRCALKGLGNAVAPPVAHAIGDAILAVDLALRSQYPAEGQTAQGGSHA